METGSKSQRNSLFFGLHSEGHVQHTISIVSLRLQIVPVDTSPRFHNLHFHMLRLPRLMPLWCNTWASLFSYIPLADFNNLKVHSIKLYPFIYLDIFIKAIQVKGLSQGYISSRGGWFLSRPLRDGFPAQAPFTVSCCQPVPDTIVSFCSIQSELTVFSLHIQVYTA